jgi:hypothetical protein
MIAGRVVVVNNDIPPLPRLAILKHVQDLDIGKVASNTAIAQQLLL